MQYTAYSIASLWKEGIKDFHIYELTKTNKVIKHKVRELVEFDDCVIIAIGNDKSSPRHRLVFSQGSSTKKVLGDSVYYVDFSAIKSKFLLRVGKEELEKEIEQAELEIKAINDLLKSKKNKLARLLTGFADEALQKLENEDKQSKDNVTLHLQKTIYHYASRYGSDLTFTFFIERLWDHSDKTKSKEELAKEYESFSGDELNALLQEKVKEKFGEKAVA